MRLSWEDWLTKRRFGGKILLVQNDYSCLNAAASSQLSPRRRGPDSNHRSRRKGTTVQTPEVFFPRRRLRHIAQPIKAYRIKGETSPTDKPPVGSYLPLPDKPSIAVLPFANMSGDPQQEYFADGMVEEVITALSRR
jgi:hypothetical protein